MKKLTAVFLLALSSSVLIFAGDAAVLVNKGFSEDGNYYFFGQYGKTDKTFQGWADFYTVDVKKNDYVDGGVFKTIPSKNTALKSGKSIYESLEVKNASYINRYEICESVADQILYIREEEKKASTEEIVFKDFTCSIGGEQAEYHVQLIPSYNGTGINAKSSFFIMIEKQGEDGKVLARQKVGTPSIRRSGVTGYKIERIECDRSGRNLIFIIEKQFEDKTGTNIRYMIEACTLNEDFSMPLKPVSESAKKVIKIEEKSSGFDEAGNNVPEKVSAGVKTVSAELNVKPVIETIQPAEIITIDLENSTVKGDADAK